MAEKPHGYTEEELALLTAEERAGLEDTTITDDYIPDEAEEAEKPADDDDNYAEGDEEGDEADEEDGADPDEGDEDGDADPQAVVEDPAAVADPAATADPIDDAALAALPAALELPNIQAVQDKVAEADAKVEEIIAKLAELEKGYDEGTLDIRQADYDAQRAELQKAERAAIREAGKLETAVEDAKQAYADSLKKWSTEIVPGFLADKHANFRNPNSSFYKVMDDYVRQEQAKTGVPLDARHLHNAYNAAIAQLTEEGVWPPKGMSKTAAKPVAAAPAPAPAPNKRPAAPPVLGGLPTAQIEATDSLDPEFAALNKLAMSNPMEFQRKLAALPEARRDLYMQD